MIKLMEFSYWTQIATVISLIILISVVVASSSDQTTEFDHSYKTYGGVLEKYVSDGHVDYNELKANPDELKQFLEQSKLVSSEEFHKWPEAQRLAYLINLFNATTLNFVIEHYPINSIKDVKVDSQSAWDLPVVNLLGESISLNSLENDVIRKNYSEPRIHFVLVCAAKGCPQLSSEPYVAETLEKQLEEQTHLFITNGEKYPIDHKARILKIAKIFEWFAGDFEKESGSVIEFISPYQSGKIDKSYKIEYVEYDWDLNEKPSS